MMRLQAWHVMESLSRPRSVQLIKQKKINKIAPVDTSSTSFFLLLVRDASFLLRISKCFLDRCELVVMVSSIATLVAAVAIASTASAQFVAPPKDLLNTTGYLDLPVRYKEVPTGIC